MAELRLGGMVWEIPALPWRVVRDVTPILGEASNGLLTGSNLRAVGEAAWRATQCATSGDRLDRAAFDELPITFQEIVAAVQVVAAACGMKRAESGEDAGKASTGQG